MATSKLHYIQFLRNTTTPLCENLAAAKEVISEQISNVKDGEPILARYYADAGKTSVKTVLGIVHKVGGKTGVTFYTDNDEIESIIKAYVGTGVTTGNTVTEQLNAINAEIDADKVKAGNAISVTTADTGTTVAVKYDGSTVILNPNGELSVVSSALTPYVGSNAVSVASGDTANTISLKIDTNDKVLTQGTNGLLTNLTLQYVTGDTTEIQLIGRDNNVIGRVDATNFIKDSFLDSVTYTPESKVLAFVWNTESGKERTNVDLSTLVDTYTAASGIAVSNNQFTGVVDSTSEQVTIGTGENASASVLSVGADGFRVDNIQKAIDYKYGLATAYTDSAKTVVTGSTYITVTPGTPAGTGTTYTVASSGLATSAELTTETNNRTTADSDIHTIMGQSTSAYVANASANYIAGASSLNNADVLLDTNLKALSGEVENVSSGSVSGVSVNGTKVTVTDHVAIVNLSGSNLNVSSGYTVPNQPSAVKSGDTIDAAIAKVEAKANANASAITAETQARENADSALSAAIDSHKVVVAADDSALDGTQYVTVSTAYTDSNSANGITYTVSVDGLAGIVAAARTDINAVSATAEGNKALIEAADAEYTAGANQFVTAVTQTNGKITAVEFGQPAAAGVTYATGETAGALTSTTVQSAVDEVNTKVNNLNTNSKVTIQSTGDSTSDVKKYVFYQGTPGDSTKIGEINIPKDLVVTSGEVVTYQDKKQIKLTLTSGNDIYIPVNELVDAYTGVTAATGVSVYVSAKNGISATLMDDTVATANIKDGAVTTPKIADGNVTSAKLASDVQTAIDASITAVSGSDTVDMVLSNRTVSANVKSSSITSTHLANSAVTEDKIAGSAVTTSKIADDAVTADKLADAVTADIASRLTQVSVNGKSATTASTAITLVTEDVHIGSGYDDTFTATTAGAPASGDTIDKALAKLYKSIAANKIANGNVTTTGTTSGGETKIDVTVDNSSIKVDTTSNALTVGTVDCGTY